MMPCSGCVLPSAPHLLRGAAAAQLRERSAHQARFRYPTRQPDHDAHRPEMTAYSPGMPVFRRVSKQRICPHCDKVIATAAYRPLLSWRRDITSPEGCQLTPLAGSVQLRIAQQQLASASPAEQHRAQWRADFISRHLSEVIYDLPCPRGHHTLVMNRRSRGQCAKPRATGSISRKLLTKEIEVLTTTKAELTRRPLTRVGSSECAPARPAMKRSSRSITSSTGPAATWASTNSALSSRRCAPPSATCGSSGADHR
jgi:hypothetical protein